ncbi:hypothetical protein [Streptomyces sp. UH6]|nr:hypothetical protein [Streptomyces sp. UH6]
MAGPESNELRARQERLTADHAAREAAHTDRLYTETVAKHG